MLQLAVPRDNGWLFTHLTPFWASSCEYQSHTSNWSRFSAACMYLVGGILDILLSLPVISGYFLLNYISLLCGLLFGNWILCAQLRLVNSISGARCQSTLCSITPKPPCGYRPSPQHVFLNTGGRVPHGRPQAASRWGSPQLCIKHLALLSWQEGWRAQAVYCETCNKSQSQDSWLIKSKRMSMT